MQITRVHTRINPGHTPGFDIFAFFTTTTHEPKLRICASGLVLLSPYFMAIHTLKCLSLL